MDYTCIHACVIHACMNDCILFCGPYEDVTHYPICGESCHKKDVSGDEVPCKVLRHFPIIPRICHMFQRKSIAGLLSWHATNCSVDGKLRIPADCEA